MQSYQNKKQFRYIGIKKDKSTYVMKVDAYFKILKVDGSWSVVFKIIHPEDIDDIFKLVPNFDGIYSQTRLRNVLARYLELEKTDIKIIIDDI